MICNTAVKDGLLERNPCQITGATNPTPKKVVNIPTTTELHAIADKLGSDDRTARFKALVLLAGWCGMRFGEVSDLRRKDFDADCTTVAISRSVTHRLSVLPPRLASDVLQPMSSRFRRCQRSSIQRHRGAPETFE